MTSDELSTMLSLCLPDSKKGSLKKLEKRNILNSETITELAILAAFEKMEKKLEDMQRNQNDFIGNNDLETEMAIV